MLGVTACLLYYSWIEHNSKLFYYECFPCDGNKPITQQFLWEKFSPILRAYHQLPKIQFKLLVKM